MQLTWLCACVCVCGGVSLATCVSHLPGISETTVKDILYQAGQGAEVFKQVDVL